MRSAPTLKIWMTPLASVAMLEKFALLKIAVCSAPVVSRASVPRPSTVGGCGLRYPVVGIVTESAGRRPDTLTRSVRRGAKGAERQVQRGSAAEPMTMGNAYRPRIVQERARRHRPPLIQSTTRPSFQCFSTLFVGKNELVTRFEQLAQSLVRQKVHPHQDGRIVLIVRRDVIDL